MENKQKSSNEVHSEPLQQCDVSGWRWFDAVIKFKDGNICNYASTTNGSIEDAKTQAANIVIGQTVEILSIAFR